MKVYVKNGLEVGKNYNIYIKEFNWKIKKVDTEINEEL